MSTNDAWGQFQALKTEFTKQIYSQRINRLLGEVPWKNLLNRMAYQVTPLLQQAERYIQVKIYRSNVLNISLKEETLTLTHYKMTECTCCFKLHNPDGPSSCRSHTERHKSIMYAFIFVLYHSWKLGYAAGFNSKPSSFPTVVTAQQNSQQTATNSDKTHQAFNLSIGAQVQYIPVKQFKVLLKLYLFGKGWKSFSSNHKIVFSIFLRQPSLYPMSQLFGTPTTPAAAGITVNDTNKSCMHYQVCIFVTLFDKMQLYLTVTHPLLLQLLQLSRTSSKQSQTLT